MLESLIELLKDLSELGCIHLESRLGLIVVTADRGGKRSLLFPSTEARPPQLRSRTTPADGRSLADFCIDMIWLTRRSDCIERPASQRFASSRWMSPSSQDSGALLSETAGTANLPLPPFTS